VGHRDDPDDGYGRDVEDHAARQSTRVCHSCAPTLRRDGPSPSAVQGIRTVLAGYGTESSRSKEQIQAVRSEQSTITQLDGGLALTPPLRIGEWPGVKGSVIAASGDDTELPYPELVSRLPGMGELDLRAALIALVDVGQLKRLAQNRAAATSIRSLKLSAARRFSVRESLTSGISLQGAALHISPAPGRPPPRSPTAAAGRFPCGGGGSGVGREASAAPATPPGAAASTPANVSPPDLPALCPSLPAGSGRGGDARGVLLHEMIERKQH
jgi:hypothetical protein